MTLPALIVALPVLAIDAPVWIAPAAAICDGPVSATLKEPAACTVG